MFPQFVMIRQHHDANRLTDLPSCVRESIHNAAFDLESLRHTVVGIAVGSRGIANISTIIKTLADVISEHGGTPVAFPAMGSHGNGSPEGQREVLASLGITEEAIECEIRTCGESVLCGETENGLQVYVNKLAVEFDKIILVNRIKPHTDFEDITESGLFKLMAIGIGNPAGAKNIHARALAVGYGAAIRDAGTYMLQKLPIVLALGVTENWRHETDYVEAILPENLPEAETRILAQVKSRTVRLPFQQFDTLIVKEAGKNISGTCVDTKVIGRIMIAGQQEPEYPKIKTIAVLDFTEESHGNSMGLGVVDLITRRVFDKINIDATSLTGMTSTCLMQAKIPCVAPNDETAVRVAYTSTGVEHAEDIRAVLIQHTNALEYMAVTENLYAEIQNNPGIEQISAPFMLEFDEQGTLLTKLPHGC